LNVLIAYYFQAIVFEKLMQL